MIPFELAEPTSLAAAIKLLDPDDETVRPIAGGTALMLMMKAGVFRPAKLVSLRKIERQYTTITAGADGLTIGAMTTLRTLERSADVRKHAPAHHAHLLTLSNVRVRNVATVGGAMAHGDPHMDLPPVLMALGASVIVAGPDGERSAAGRGFVLRLLRDRAGEERTDRLGSGARAGQQARGLYEGHDRLGRRLAGARRRGRASRATATPSSRRASSPAPRPRRRRGSPSAEAVLNGNRIDDTLVAARRPMRRRTRPSSSPTCAARCRTSEN